MAGVLGFSKDHVSSLSLYFCYTAVVNTFDYVGDVSLNTFRTLLN